MKKCFLLQKMSLFAAPASTKVGATEPYVKLDLPAYAYTSAKISFTVTSSVGGTYRLCNSTSYAAVSENGINVTTADLTVAAGKSGSWKLTGLKPNTAYKFFLVKLDKTTATTKYVPQMPATSLSTFDPYFWCVFTTDVTTITMTGQSSNRINFIWNIGKDATANYVVCWLAVTDTPDKMLAFDIGPSTPTYIDPKAQTYYCPMKNLVPGMDYTVYLFVKNPTATLKAQSYVPSGFTKPNFDLVDTSTLSPAIQELMYLYNAPTKFKLTLPVPGVSLGASYIAVQWEGNGLSNYRLLMKDPTQKPLVTGTNTMSYGKVLLDNYKNETGNGAFVVSNLTPGTSYSFVLQEYDMDDSTIVYDSILTPLTLTTLSSTLTLSNADTDSIVASWTKPYTGARFELKVKAKDADESTVITIPKTTDISLTDATYTITGLDPNKTYEVRLYIVEPGTAGPTNLNLPLGFDFLTTVPVFGGLPVEMKLLILAGVLGGIWYYNKKD
jgi:hypothetical protein